MPFPEQWRGYLEANIACWATLDADERRRLCALVQVFVAERPFVGCEGQAIDDEVKVTIAGQACLLLLNINHDYFSNVTDILVHPDAQQSEEFEMDIGGMSVTAVTETLGVAHYRGPIVLSWADVRHGGLNAEDGRNVVYHEFAHALDMLNDLVDGTPPLNSRGDLKRWVAVMTESYNRLRANADRGKRTFLDRYGAQNPGEFFAVATEQFFEQPRQMKESEPALYDVLAAYFRQDPAGR